MHLNIFFMNSQTRHFHLLSNCCWQHLEHNYQLKYVSGRLIQCWTLLYKKMEHEGKIQIIKSLCWHINKYLNLRVAGGCLSLYLKSTKQEHFQCSVALFVVVFSDGASMSTLSRLWLCHIVDYMLIFRFLTPRFTVFSTRPIPAVAAV